MTRVMVVVTGTMKVVVQIVTITMKVVVQVMTVITNNYFKDFVFCRNPGSYP